MKYNAYIKNSFDSKLVDEQESLINDYISSKKITIDVKYYSKELHKYKSKLSIVDLVRDFTPMFPLISQISFHPFH